MKKYQKVYMDIYEKIKNGNLKSGDKLKSEKELMEEYNVSRHTIRKALDILQERGFLQKSQGASTTITYKDPFSMPVSEITSFQELNKLMGLEAKTEVVNLEIIQDKKISKKLFGLDSDEEIYKITRTREIEGQKVILDIDYIRKNIINNLPLTVAQNSIYKYIEEDLGLSIGYAIKQFYAETPSKEDLELLDMKNYNVIIVVESQTFLQDNTIFQHTLSRHRPDKFKFVDIAKRSI